MFTHLIFDLLIVEVKWEGFHSHSLFKIRSLLDFSSGTLPSLLTVICSKLLYSVTLKCHLELVTCQSSIHKWGFSSKDTFEHKNQLNRKSLHHVSKNRSEIRLGYRSTCHECKAKWHDHCQFLCLSHEWLYSRWHGSPFATKKISRQIWL